MIAKTLLNRSFEATLRYVLKPDATLIDTNEASAAAGDPPQKIAEAFDRTARGRSEKPCYHIALSPRATDQLQSEQWEQLSRDFLAELGIKCQLHF